MADLAESIERAWTRAGKDPRYQPKTVGAVLAYLVEECAEVQKETGKAIRFGLSNAHPMTKKKNAAQLAIELADLDLALQLAHMVIGTELGQ